jgi:hypothetical protein
MAMLDNQRSDSRNSTLCCPAQVKALQQANSTTKNLNLMFHHPLYCMQYSKCRSLTSWTSSFSSSESTLTDVRVLLFDLVVLAGAAVFFRPLLLLVATARVALVRRTPKKYAWCSQEFSIIPNYITRPQHDNAFLSLKWNISQITCA